MNAFILDLDPHTAARAHCDKHVPKMVVEVAQMLASAVLRHNPDAVLATLWPITKKGTPYKGGYHHHPVTKWTGENWSNFSWLSEYGKALSAEYTIRFGKTHGCHWAIHDLTLIGNSVLPWGELTPFAQAMPDEFRNADPVVAYRDYYHSKTFAKWDKGTPAPDWWKGLEVTA